MTDVTTYPLIDDFDTTLAQAWDGATGTIYLNEAIGVTIPSGVTTLVVVSPGKSIMQVAEISAVDNSLKTATVSSISVDKGAGVAYTQQTHPVGSVVRISTNYAFWKDLVDGINTKVDTNSDDIEVGKFADATARDAYFTSPVNGNSAYLTSEGKRTDYIAGAWADRDVGTVTANASETVAGKVEIATQAEFDAGTGAGGTGALTVPTNDQIRKQINTATAKSTPVNADSIGIADSAASGVIKKTTLTELKAASDMQATTTTSGFVKLATDAEFYTGTDATRYVNALQVQSMFTIIAGTNVFASADTERSVLGTTYTKVKEITILKTGTYTIVFDLRNGGAAAGYGKVYKNGVGFGSERSQATDVYTTQGENLAFTAGDLCQLYLKHDWPGGTSYAKNFRVQGAVTVAPEGIPDAYIGTVNTN